MRARLRHLGVEFAIGTGPGDTTVMAGQPISDSVWGRRRAKTAGPVATAPPPSPVSG
jgi:hypothetical protein